MVTGHPIVFADPDDNYDEDPSHTDDGEVTEAGDGDTLNSAMLTADAFDKHYRRTWMSADLGGMAELDPAIDLSVVQGLASDVLAVQDRLRSEAPDGLQRFPFQRRERDSIQGARPHYLAEFPPPNC